MKKLILILLFLNFNAHAFHHVCSRSPDAIRLLQAMTNKRCGAITQEDLALVERIDAAAWSIAPITQLRNLDLSDMPNLNWLSITNQRLTSLPEDLLGGRHEKLMALNLSNNQMSEIPSLFLAKLPMLATFIMNNNRVVNLNAGAFTRNPYLQYLALSGNLITSIPDGIFRLASLFILGLENNRISSLPEDFLLDQHNIHALYLGNNQIYRLPDNMFVDNNNSLIEVIDIAGNPVIDLLTPEMRGRLPSFVEIYQ